MAGFFLSACSLRLTPTHLDDIVLTSDEGVRYRLEWQTGWGNAWFIYQEVDLGGGKTAWVNASNFPED